MLTVKIINKTAALQIILLQGGQQMPIPTTDAGVTNTFDPEREDDDAQAVRLYKALTSPSIKRQREMQPPEIVVEGFEKLEQLAHEIEPELADTKAAKRIKQSGGSSGAGGSTDLPKTLEGLNVTQATNVLATVTDVAVLEAWAAQEKRTTVQSALADRIAKVKGSSGAGGST